MQTGRNKISASCVCSFFPLPAGIEPFRIQYWRYDISHYFSTDSCRYFYSVRKFQSFRDTQSAVIVGILGDYDPTQSLGRHRDGHFPGENMPATILEIVLKLTYAADFVSLRRVHADTRLVLSYIGGHHQYTEL